MDQKTKVYTKVKEYVFNKEIEQWSTRVNYDEYGAAKLIKSNPNYWVFNPAEAVTYVLKMYFNSTHISFYRLNIFGITVDTQNETIDVTIKLKRPGLLIGGGGKNIAEVEKRLQTVFNMPTKIHIEEVKNDINEPFICY
jgi:ribosomal protein S3